MPIFIPLFVVIFIVAPVLLAKMAMDLLHLRGWRWMLLLTLIMGVLNWQMWQAAPDKARQLSQQAASRGPMGSAP